MEDACLTLEREFKRVCIDLEYSSRCLETQSKNSDPSVPDVFGLVNRIKALDEKMETIRAKTQTLGEKRETAVMQTASSVIDNFNAIRQLMLECHCEDFDPSWEEQKEILEAMLVTGSRKEIVTSVDAPLQSQQEHQLQQERQQQAEHPMPSKQSQQHTASVRFEAPDDAENTEPAANQHPAAAENDMDKSFSHSAKFCALDVPGPPVISDDDFNDIPSHVRGRCTLADIERVLSKLREGFEKHWRQNTAGAAAGKSKKKKGLSSSSVASASSSFATTSKKRGSSVSHSGGSAMSDFSMTLQQLEACGCRVSGQTGMCVLKTLQRLGYVDLAKRGEVVTLTHAGCDDIINIHSQHYHGKSK